jgi:hypothetical protein
MVNLIERMPYFQIEARRNLLHSRFRRFLTFKGSGIGIKEYLGNDLAGLREWIESNFLEGMTWENYGEYWVVDHIVPMRLFNLFDEDELKLCYHYKNLMPLLKRDNQNKEGNLFFCYELLFWLKEKDFFYQKLFDRIQDEVHRMSSYINKFHEKYMIGN